MTRDAIERAAAEIARRVAEAPPQARMDDAYLAQLVREMSAQVLTDVVAPQASEYLVWSVEHAGWWRPGSWGYSTGLRDAARFVRPAAINICRNALPTAAHIGMISEIPVRVDDITDVLRDLPVPGAVHTGER